MGRPKKEASEHKPADAFTGLLAAAYSKFGVDDITTGKTAHSKHIGIPLQSLALEYLIGSDKLLLGKVYGISGPSMSFKSSLTLDFARQIASVSGTGFMVETEGEKISPKSISSILGPLQERLIVRPVDSVDKAQATLTWAFEWMQKTYPKRDALVALFVDSLSGAGTEARAEAIHKEGYAQQTYASEARMWTDWLKSISSRLRGWPSILMYVSHEKPKIGDTTGHGKTRPGGGFAQEFYATVYFSVRRIKEAKLENKTITHLNMKVIKHSFGECFRDIDFTFVYDFSGPESTLTFDWDTATAQLLVEHSKRIARLFHVEPSTASIEAVTRTYSCKELGLKDVTSRELVNTINADTNLMVELRKCFGIEHYEQWNGVMPVENELVVLNHQIDEVAEPEDKEPDDSVDM